MPNPYSVILFSISIVVGGCVTQPTKPSWLTNTDTLIRLNSAGKCSEAIAMLNGDTTNSNTKIRGLALAIRGLIAADCERNMAQGKAYMTLSARHGNAIAQEFLVKQGFPVPAADLMEREVDTGLSATDMMFLQTLSTPSRSRSTSTVCRKIGSAVHCDSD
jgi:hypothetical protein